MGYWKTMRNSCWFWKKINLYWIYKMPKLTYRTIINEFHYEIPKIKWSRFLTYIFPCEDKENLEILLEKVKKEHFSATHHCSAYRLWIQVHEDLFWNILIDPKVSRSNDDGEPANTAWKPILNILESEKLLNVLAIVVRYFWWTLLWVGGLIQAYSQAAKDAVMNCNIVEKEILKEFELIHEYNQTSLIAYLMEKYDMKLISEICDEKSKKILTINQWLFYDFNKELFESSNGNLSVS